MGKRIIARARGKGGPRYKSPSHRYLGRVEYASTNNIKGEVVDIVHDPGRTAPVAVIKLEDGKKIYHIASEELKVGDTINYDKGLSVGNVLSLSEIPDGTKIHCIETFPGSGPKICRSGGSFAMVVGKTDDKVTVRFSSGKIKTIDSKCRATIGVPAGSGRMEKPFTKAGKKFYALSARGRLYPITKGVVMSPVDHPYGGRSKRPRHGKAVSRSAPPGAKVGSIAPRRLGKKKGK